MKNNESCAAPCGADEALFASILADVPPADYVPAPVPMEPEHVENVRKLEAAGAALWCAYSLTAAGASGKRGKVPRSRDGSRRIGSNAPGSFYSLDDALALNQAGKAHGVGILVSGAPGIVGIDLDKCIGPDGELAGWAAAIVERFATYTEVSVSGTGLHLFMLATKPPEYTKEKYKDDTGVELEVYGSDCTRFLTVSGKLWRDGLGQIEPRQAVLDEWLAEVFDTPNTGGGVSVGAGAVGRVGRAGRAGADAANDADSEAEGRGTIAAGAANGDAEAKGRGPASSDSEPELSDEAVLKLLRVNNKRGKITALLRGDWEGEYQSQSDADLALMAEIAYYTADVDLAVEVFGQSGLVKTVDRKGNYKRQDDYLYRTAEKAIASRSSSYWQDKQAKAAGIAKQAQKDSDMGSLLIGGLAGMAVSGKGRLKRSKGNLVKIIERAYALAGLCVFDTFSMDVVRNGQLPEEILGRLPHIAGLDPIQPVSDGDLCGLSAWLSDKFELEHTKQEVLDALFVVGRKAPVNMVASCLDRLVWDGVPRIGTWLRDYFDASKEDGESYLRAVGRAWLIQMVKRAYEPRCKADYMLILEGPQGLKKSEAVFVIGTAIRPGTFRNGLPSMKHGNDTEAKRSLRGAWVVELAELSFMKGADFEHVKEFLTRREDDYRDPYAVRSGKFQRTCVFIGNVNPGGNGYINDHTGARRFWPVACRDVKLAELQRDIGQLLAEAVAAYKAGEPEWLNNQLDQAMAIKAANKRISVDAWTEAVYAYLAAHAGQLVGLEEIWVEAFKGNKSEFGKREQDRITAILHRSNCIDRHRNNGNFWEVPANFGD